MGGAQNTTTEYRTGDMTLAAYLCVRGRRYDRLERDGEPNKAVWVFPDVGDLIGIVDEFYEGDAEVEPRKFNRSIRKCRDDLYDFLGIGRHRAA